MKSRKIATGTRPLSALFAVILAVTLSAAGIALGPAPASAADNPNPDRITDDSWWLMQQLLALDPGTQNGGIYAPKSGYHNTRAANDADDYSVRDAEDQGGPSDKAAAYDWTFPEAQGLALTSLDADAEPDLPLPPVPLAATSDYSNIARYASRLLASGKDPSDPRLDGWREFYGQTDSDSSVEGWDFRYDEAVTSDSSHLWHIHLSEDRDKVTSRANKEALLSVLRGETVEQWLNKSGSPDDVSRDGVIVGTDGRISLYTVRADGDVWGRSQATVGGVFNNWQRLSTGGGFAGRVAVLRDDLNRVALYVRRDGTIYGASQAEAGGSFGTWKVIGTNGAGVTGDPRAVYGYQGRIAIYATTGSGNLSGVNQTSPGGGFGSWQQLTTGGGYTGKPTALVDVRQRVALYVRRNGTIYGASQSEAGGSFGAWGPMGTGGAGVASDPTAVYGVGGRVTIYVTNGSGDVSGVNQTSAGGAFGAWQVLTNTGGYTGKPTVLVDSYSRIAVYVRRNGTIYGASQPEAGGAFGTWAARGTGSPVITGDPTAVYGAGKRIAIYAASTDDTIGGVNQEEAGGAFGAWVLL
jgi:hypothetical protein